MLVNALNPRASGSSHLLTGFAREVSWVFLIPSSPADRQTVSVERALQGDVRLSWNIE